MYLTNSYLCFFAHMPSREVFAFGSWADMDMVKFSFFIHFLGSDIEIWITQQESAKDKTLDKTLVCTEERCTFLVPILFGKSLFPNIFKDMLIFHCKDPYFPHGIVDLRYAVSCDPSGEKGFRLRTNSRTIVLSADSVPSREEWVKAIRKVIFKAQNMGDSVKVNGTRKTCEDITEPFIFRLQFLIQLS